MGSRNKYGMKFRKSEIKDLIKKNKSPNKAKSRNFDYYTENKKKRNEKCPIHDHRDIEELYETRLKNK